MPGWGRQRFTLLVGLTILFAVVLRVSITGGIAGDPIYSQAYQPVAAAIGLTHDVPADAALSTWINAGLYTLNYAALSVVSPETSPVDFCARFLADPAGFSALAVFAGLIATATAIFLTYRLVARLLDPVAGFAAAFIIAIHPAAIALTNGIDSGAFCLVFLLCGLSVAAGMDWERARAIDLAAIGLSLGFAMDALPLAVPLLAVVIVFAVRATPHERRGRLAGQVAVGLVCFALATATVIPERIPLLETAHVMALSTAIVAALLIAAHALRSLRHVVGDSAYSSLVLMITLGVGLFAIASVSAPGPDSISDPGLLASDWLIDNAVANSAIIVHPDLADIVPLPRNAASWHRQYEATRSGHTKMRMRALAAARAARELPGPRFDVTYPPAERAEVANTHAAGPPREVHYLVLPATCDPASFGSDAFWLVARFGATPSHPGVIIWGTQAAPDVEPVHVKWRMRRGHALTCLPAG